MHKLVVQRRQQPDRDRPGYTYDAAGNLTKDVQQLDQHTYQWDGEGRVSTVDPGSSPTWSFTYNALGHRVQWAYHGRGRSAPV